MDIEELKHFRRKLKSGQYDSNDIMLACISIEELIELREWRDKAFEVHPNLDLDIENAQALTLTLKMTFEEQTIVDDLRKLRSVYGLLPGEALSRMLNNPQLYGIDSLSAEIHNQVSRLRLVQEKYLNSMEISFLETFPQYDY